MAVGIGDDDRAFALDDISKADQTVDFRQNRGVPRTTGFKQFTDTRKTAGDILGLDPLLEELRQNHALGDFRVVGNLDVGTAGKEVDGEHIALALLLAGDFNSRLQ